MIDILNLSSLGLPAGSILMLVLILALLASGMPLAFTTAIVALFFGLFWLGPDSIFLAASRSYGFITSYVFVSVPMFVLMASVLERSGIAKDLFDLMRLVSRRIPGGVAVQTVFVAVFLASMSGIIGGEIILLGLLALPQMLRLQYPASLAIGTVCAGGALGTMVPPSIVLIVYGMVANVSIADLFAASIVPALLLATAYILYIVAVSYRHGIGSSAAISEASDNQPVSWILLARVSLPLLVATSVLGSIYLGIASVTEASAVGAAGVLFSTFVRGELNAKLLRESTSQTLRTCGMIIWIGIGASMLVGVYTLMGGAEFVNTLLLGMGDGSPYVVLVTMILILFVLGLFLDWVGIALLAMPIFVPIVISLGYDAVWFGVLFSLNMQVSFLSPPFGPAVFYLKSVAPPEISVQKIFIAVLPFIAIQVLILVLLISYPQLVLWWR